MTRDKLPAKEVDPIAVPDMPTPDTYRRWKNLVGELVCSPSGKPDIEDLGNGS